MIIAIIGVIMIVVSMSVVAIDANNGMRLSNGALGLLIAMVLVGVVILMIGGLSMLAGYSTDRKVEACRRIYPEQTEDWCRDYVLINAR